MERELPEALGRYMDGLKAHDVALVGSAVSDRLCFVTEAKVLGKEAFLEMLGRLYRAFPDWHYEHDPAEWQEDRWAIKWRQGGTHTGRLEVPGRAVLAATGRKVQIPEQYFFYKVGGDGVAEIRPDPIPGGAPEGIFEALMRERGGGGDISGR